MTAPTASESASAIIIIAHGSRSEEANTAHLNTCRRLEDRTGGTVRPAFLELAEPSLHSAVARCAAEAVTEITVIPYFLYPGRHVQRDIPELIAAATEAFPGITVRMSELFGANPLVIDALASIVDQSN